MIQDAWMSLILDSFISILTSLAAFPGSIGEGGGVSDGRRSQRFYIMSLLVFESFTSNFIMGEHKLTYC